MNKSLLTYSGILLIGALSISSCKMQDKPTPRKDITSAVDNFFEKNDVLPQKFSVNTSTTSLITASEGTIITIPANAFEDANGNPVTGTVNLDVKEVFDKSDMVLSGVTTQSNGSLLISGGEIFIGATSGGREVFLSDNATIDVSIPIEGEPDPNMNLFVGEATDTGGVDWQPVDTIQDSLNVVLDTTGQNNVIWYYQFTSTTIGWINCDYFYNRPSTTLTVNLPSIDALNGKTVSGAVVYAIYKELNVVASVYQISSCAATTCPSAAFSGQAGLGEDIYLLTVANIDGKLHYSLKEFTIEANHSITLTPAELTEVTETQLESIIEAF